MVLLSRPTDGLNHGEPDALRSHFPSQRQIVGARAGKIAAVEDQLVPVMLVDGLEAVVFGHVEGL
ncbi:hypothetical protein ACC738_38870, partial [Rhizobium ruizarguesonis]